MKISGFIFLERGFYKHTTCMSICSNRSISVCCPTAKHQPWPTEHSRTKSKVKKKKKKIKKLENVMGLDTDYATKKKKHTSVIKNWAKLIFSELNAGDLNSLPLKPSCQQSMPSQKHFFLQYFCLLLEFLNATVKILSSYTNTNKTNHCKKRFTAKETKYWGTS